MTGKPEFGDVLSYVCLASLACAIATYAHKIGHSWTVVAVIFAALALLRAAINSFRYAFQFGENPFKDFGQGFATKALGLLVLMLPRAAVLMGFLWVFSFTTLMISTASIYVFQGVPPVPVIASHTVANAKQAAIMLPDQISGAWAIVQGVL